MDRYTGVMEFTNHPPRKFLALMEIGGRNNWLDGGGICRQARDNVDKIDGQIDLIETRKR